MGSVDQLGLLQHFSCVVDGQSVFFEEIALVGVEEVHVLEFLLVAQGGVGFVGAVLLVVVQQFLFEVML